MASCSEGKELPVASKIGPDQGAEDAITRHFATAYDARDMDAFGLKQTFRRRFTVLAMLGFSSTVVTAWQTTLATFSFALFNGGTGGLFCKIAIVAGADYRAAQLTS